MAKTLTRAQAIKRLQKLADVWPPDLELFSQSGSLLVVGKHNKILAYIRGILNDGGDVGTEIDDDGDEVLCDR